LTTDLVSYCRYHIILSFPGSLFFSSSFPPFTLQSPHDSAFPYSSVDDTGPFEPFPSHFFPCMVRQYLHRQLSHECRQRLGHLTPHIMTHHSSGHWT
jgi:hypothetical protein